MERLSDTSEAIAYLADGTQLFKGRSSFPNYRASLHERVQEPSNIRCLNRLLIAETSSFLRDDAFILGSPVVIGYLKKFLSSYVLDELRFCVACIG